MSQTYFLEKNDYNIANSDMSAISRAQEYSNMQHFLTDLVFAHWEQWVHLFERTTYLLLIA